MNTGETSDQIVRMTLQGIEVAANVALKAGGEMTRSLAATLYAILTDKKKVKGKARLDSLLKSGKELKVFAIRHEDLKKFCEEAKKFNILLVPGSVFKKPGYFRLAYCVSYETIVNSLPAFSKLMEQYRL